MSDDDALDLLFAEETAVNVADGWKVLIVDDEPEMHVVTRLALRALRYQERPIDLLSAHSAAEARSVLREHADIALVLLDVVMETDDAGLRLAREIREVMANDRIRIVLRTGQAGQAPERDVVLNYDINDYKEKTELTAQKLVTTVISALRAYQAIEEVARLNRELEQTVAERTAELRHSNARLRSSLEALQQGEQAGRRVQFKLLPGQDWAQAGYRFSHCLAPSEYMSGDFVDYQPIDSQRVLFYIADVAGHGVASAFVTVYLKRFIGAAQEAARAGHGVAIDDPAALLRQLNSELLRERIGKHIAVFVGVLDCHSGTLCYANGGAFPPPWRISAKGCVALAQPSTPVGLLDEVDYQNQHHQLAADERLLMVSDGALELLQGHDHASKLAQLQALPLGRLQQAGELLDWLGAGAGRPPPPDDVTVLLIRPEARS